MYNTQIATYDDFLALNDELKIYQDICNSWPLKFMSLEKNFRSNLQRCSIKKGVLKNFANLQENLRQSLIFDKVAGQGLQLYQNRDSGTGVFL